MVVIVGRDPGDDEVQAPLLGVGINSLQEPQLEFRDALANYRFALWVAGEVAPPLKLAAVREVQRLHAVFDSHSAIGPDGARGRDAEVV